MIAKSGLIKYLEREFIEPYEQESREITKNIALAKLNEDEGRFIELTKKRLMMIGSITTVKEMIEDIKAGKLDGYTGEFKG
jgi:hypothetical protein